MIRWVRGSALHGWAKVGVVGQQSSLTHTHIIKIVVVYKMTPEGMQDLRQNCLYFMEWIRHKLLEGA